MMYPLPNQVIGKYTQWVKDNVKHRIRFEMWMLLSHGNIETLHTVIDHYARMSRLINHGQHLGVRIAIYTGCLNSRLLVAS